MTRKNEYARLRRDRIQLGDLFPALELLSGEGDSYRSLEILRISPVEKAREGDLVFVAQENLLTTLKESAPTAAVVSDSLFEKARALGLRFPLLHVKDA